jgi:hypothetical protein
MAVTLTQLTAFLAVVRKHRQRNFKVATRIADGPSG